MRGSQGNRFLRTRPTILNMVLDNLESCAHYFFWVTGKVCQLCFQLILQYKAMQMPDSLIYSLDNNQQYISQKSVKFPMGQQQSLPEPHSARNYHLQDNPQVKNQFRSNNPNVKQHEGILKLRPTPFPGCVQISNDGMLLFLENAQATLYELLESRLYTNRLFPLEDVERLIENVVYTLAFLAESRVTYRDLCPANIYYCNGVFKLLPNELIEQRIYDRAWQTFYGLRQPDQQQSSFPYLSPQLIIALRMKEKHISDPQILNKSNVFILGLILLQATTLLPSSQCYDPTNYDIFNNIITERLDLVEEHYNEGIARIVANMIDYDFNQRMDLKELAIWVNRELMAGRGDRRGFDTGDEKKTLGPSKSTLTIHKSRYLCNNQVQKQKVQVQECNPVVNAPTPEPQPHRNYSRSNMVYITGYDDSGRQDSRFVEPCRGAKNYIYLESLPQYEADYQIEKKTQDRQILQPSNSNLNLNTNLGLNLKSRLNGNPSLYNLQVQTRNIMRASNANLNVNRYAYQKEEKYTRYQEQVERVYGDEMKLNRNYTESVSYVPYVAPPSAYLREVENYRQKFQDQDSTQNKKPLQAQNSSEQSDHPTSKPPRNEHRFYPNLSQIQNFQRPPAPTETTTKRLPKQSEADRNSRARERERERERDREYFDSKQSKQSDSKCSINDGSINRIKMEIQKSRKLIEEFRRTEGIAQ